MKRNYQIGELCLSVEYEQETDKRLLIFGVVTGKRNGYYSIHWSDRLDAIEYREFQVERFFEDFEIELNKNNSENDTND